MSQSAHVISVAALAEFRTGMCVFIDEARNAMATLEMEIRRAEDWLARQLQHWKDEVREAEDEVVQARNQLARRKMMRISDRPPDTTEQEKALARAKAWLEHAQEKLAATKRWLWTLPEEIREYQGFSRLFQDIVESDLPKVVAMLGRKISSLEAYNQLSASAPASGGRKPPD